MFKRSLKGIKMHVKMNKMAIMFSMNADHVLHICKPCMLCDYFYPFTPTKSAKFKLREKS